MMHAKYVYAFLPTATNCLTGDKNVL